LRKGFCISNLEISFAKINFETECFACGTGTVPGTTVVAPALPLFRSACPSFFVSLLKVGAGRVTQTMKIFAVCESALAKHYFFAKRFLILKRNDRSEKLISKNQVSQIFSNLTIIVTC
jgi:hypothetical protein